MQRLQIKTILKDLQKKMVLISGPRQVGKTWISKEIMKHYQKPLYLNYDFGPDQKLIKAQNWQTTYLQKP